MAKSAIAGAIALTMALAPAMASAQQVKPLTYTGNFDGAASSAGPVGPSSREIDVNDVTGNILVLTKSRTGRYVVDQFDDEGNPVSFTSPGLRGATSLVLPPLEGESGPTMTVDNSATGTQGRIYVGGSQNSQIFAYNADGSAVPGFPVTGEPRGLAVDPRNGELISMQRGGVERYLPSGKALPSRFGVEQFGTRIATDPEGDIYIENRKGVTKYSPSGAEMYTLEPFNGRIPSYDNVTVDPLTGDVYTFGSIENVVQVSEYNARGTRIGTYGIPTPGFGENEQVGGLAFDPLSGKLFAGDNAAQRVDIFSPTPTVTLPEAVAGGGEAVEPTSVTLNGTVELEGLASTSCTFQYGIEIPNGWGPEKPYENSVPCSQGQVLSGGGAVTVTAPLAGLTKGQAYHYRLVVGNSNGMVKSLDRSFRPAARPAISGDYVTDVHADTADLHASLNPEGAPTTWYFEYGTAPCSAAPGACARTATESAASGLTPVAVSKVILALQQGTTYYYRLVATNGAGTTDGPERTFTTFPAAPPLIDTCANAHVRQQTSSALLLDCRAYELVSAADTGGYNVDSTLVPGQTPFDSYPDAETPPSVLYGTVGGGVPNVGNPTNHGLDPYVASRTESGWVTKYVGIPSDDPAAIAGGPFGSPLLEADPTLGALAFGGAELCNPCFPDGSGGIPVRRSDGQLVQGMAGSIPQPGATPAGHVGRALSADGNHLVFGSTSQFEPAGNSNGDISIYERDLNAGQTQVVSTLPNGATMTGAGIGELGVSADGSRVLVGQAVRTDSAGNTYWRLLMHVGNSPNSVEVAPGETTGVLFDGMSADGSRVYFTTADALLPGDTDHSADIYEATIGGAGQPAALRLVSQGSGPGEGDSCQPAEDWNVVSGGDTCGAVAIGGGGGVAEDGGTIFFLSPELLAGAGQGAVGEPNLFVASAGGAPRFVATIDSDAEGPISNPTVVDSVTEAEAHHYANFQMTPDGAFAAFPSAEPLTGYLSDGDLEVYRDVSSSGAAGLACVSCATTNSKAIADASLPVGGLGLTTDGRVFFNSQDSLAPRDLDKVGDAYEWESGVQQLISTGTSLNASALLGVDASGTDAYFFTHDTLVPQDTNGNHVKIYDARAGGGFAFTPEPVPCKAADECHGPSSEPAPSPPINTLAGQGGNYGAPAAAKCAKGKVRKHGKCVKEAKPKKKTKHAKKKHSKTKGQKAKQGGDGHA